MQSKFKSIFTSVLLLCSLASSYAISPKEKQGWQERMMAEKIAFFTTEIGLTPKEAELFWPIYNQVMDEKHLAFKENHQAYDALMECIENESDDNHIRQATQNYLETLNKSNEIDKRAAEKYAKVLSAKKVGLVFLTEEKFRRHQIRQLSKKPHE